jgi:serine phosphatase RsbU (regulator of sigma subunit)/putative methionine-R-sulfoxide reductase with GAF domain
MVGPILSPEAISPEDARWRNRFVESLGAGDDIGGWAVLNDALAAGLSPAEVATAIVAPATAGLTDGAAVAVAARLLSRLAQRVVPAAAPPTVPPPDEMVRRLQKITDAALVHLDLDDLLDEITARTCEALDAETMAIFLREGNELFSRATRCPDGVLREDVRVAIGEGLAGRIAQHRGPSLLDDLAEIAPDAPLYKLKRVRSLIGVPLVVGGEMGGELVGVVHVGSLRPRHFTDDDARFLELVADRVAQAIERSRLFTAEREARTLAEATQRRLAFLTTAGEALARSLDWQTTLQTMVEQAVPFLADWCAVDFTGDDGELHCAAAVHRVPALLPLVRQLHDSRPPDMREARGVGRVLRTGDAAFWPVIHHEAMARLAGTPERLALFQELSPVSAMVLPIRVRGRLLGAASFVHATSGRRYSEADMALAEELVRRTTMALDNAQLFAERSEVARTLQASLLPPHLPDIPGIDVDGLYRAGGEGVEVGGDFYDVFLTEPGDWALVVGDVCGKGAEAAAVTAMGRYTLRAAAMQARRPSRVLHVLNEAMLRQDSVRPFLTVAYVRLQLGAGSAVDGGEAARVTVGCGGHPLPLLLRASGEVETVGRAGSLLGCFAEIDVEDVSVDLHPGDSLVLYTDGVEEARDAAGAVLGVDGLRRVVAEAAGMSPSAINEHVLDAVSAHQAGRASDDVAILTLRLR